MRGIFVLAFLEGLFYGVNKFDKSLETNREQVRIHNKEIITPDLG
jgi:hypothetical protein